MKKFEFAKIREVQLHSGTIDVLISIQSSDTEFNLVLFTWIGKMDIQCDFSYPTLEEAERAYNAVSDEFIATFVEFCLTDVKTKELQLKLKAFAYAPLLEEKMAPEKKNVLTLRKVSSSNIKAVGYDGKSLFVEFMNGGLYEYANVDVEVFRRIFDVASVGAYINSEVKGKYIATPVELEKQYIDDNKS